MPFPWTAVIGAGIGIGQGVAGWLGGNSKAKAENKAKREQYLAQRNSAFANTRAQDEVNTLNYAWKVAETEGIRFQEDQEKADYDFAMGRLADSALASMDINEQAIFDQYSTSEDLRATEAQLGLDFELGKVAEESAARSGLIGNDLQYQLATAGNNANFQVDKLRLETNDAVRGYITSIQDNASQARATAMGQNRQLEQLIQGQVIDGQMDALQRDISFAASLADRGQAVASGLGRGVSASTAKSLQMNAAKKLGRSYGELLLNQRKRKNSLGTLNASMQGEVAEGLNRFALASNRALSDIASAEERFAMGKEFEKNRLSQTGNYQLGEASLEGNLVMNTAQRAGNYATDQFEKLTIPGFDLAGRQGQRELDSLFISTQGELDRAGMPFRERIIFDPQKPLPGMYTNILPPTYSQGPSVASGIANTVISGVKGAMAGRGVDSAGNGYWF